MKNYLATGLFIAAMYQHTLAAASPPAIQIIFSDPWGLCKNQKGQTEFSFNYKYQSSRGIEYYSGPVFVNHSHEIITAPPLPDGKTDSFTDFEITDQGPCGKMDLDYPNPGPCYLTNLIPPVDQAYPYSYKITLTPKMTADQIYQRPMYQLTCEISRV